MKARRAAIRARAKVKRDKAFKEIETIQKEKIADELREQAEIKKALTSGDAEAQACMMADEFGAALTGISGTREEDMEQKRRAEQGIKQKHDRMIVDVIGKDLKMEQQQDKDIQAEIERLARTHDPYKEKIARRADLMNRLTDATS